MRASRQSMAVCARAELRNAVVKGINSSTDTGSRWMDVGLMSCQRHLSRPPSSRIEARNSGTFSSSHHPLLDRRKQSADPLKTSRPIRRPLLDVGQPRNPPHVTALTQPGEKRLGACAMEGALVCSESIARDGFEEQDASVSQVETGKPDAFGHCHQACVLSGRPRPRAIATHQKVWAHDLKRDLDGVDRRRQRPHLDEEWFRADGHHDEARLRCGAMGTGGP